MVKRGDELREHMLSIAKDVFLEAGFERASMDVIAARAGTTKRTLYAHFESKEKLFLAVIKLIRGKLIDRLQTPHDTSDDPHEALALYCGRLLETLLWTPSIRMYRLTLAEVERFPDGASQLYEAIFGTAQAWLEAFLREQLALTPKAATQAASALLARVLYPRFLRTLFGVEAASTHRHAKLDLKPFRSAVAELVPKARS